MKKERINYWTEAGLAAKKQLQSQKIYDKKAHHFRHPKLSDITFEIKEVESLPELSREERRKKFEESRIARKNKLNDIPYSEFHNKLINGTYSRRVDAFKKSALEAAHENAIRMIQIKRSILKSMRTFNNDKNKPNLLIINKEHDWNISTFMIIPSSHNMDTLRRIGIEMADKLTVSMKEFFDIEIWEKSEYMKKIAGERANYRYQIGKKQAA